MIHRRGLLTGLASLIAAPTIVRAASLMPVKMYRPEWTHIRGNVGSASVAFWAKYDPLLYTEQQLAERVYGMFVNGDPLIWKELSELAKPTVLDDILITNDGKSFGLPRPGDFLFEHRGLRTQVMPPDFVAFDP